MVSIVIINHGISREELNKIIENTGKSEYEKNVEPYQKEMAFLQRKITSQREDLLALIRAVKFLIASIDNDYITIQINTENSKAQFQNISDNPISAKVVTTEVHIKHDLYNNFIDTYNYIKEKNHKYRKY